MEVQAEQAAILAVKLVKAEEFLLIAKLALEGPYPDAAVSSAAICAINASDALCLLYLGYVLSGEQHERAVRELARAGLKQESEQLGRTLSIKSKAQYSGRHCTEREAQDSVKRAERLVSSARGKAAAAGEG